MAPRPDRTTARDRSRRVLSQNFLADPAAVSRMVRAARTGPDDLLLEVGAGRGQLTRPLAQRCGRLIAYEVDPTVIPALAAVCATLPHVRHRQADFLTAAPPDEPFDVVGNVPWS
ncbi:rRNA adenine N-6-methyltransferase family protein, partial [Micromonospora humida]